MLGECWCRAAWPDAEVYLVLRSAMSVLFTIAGGFTGDGIRQNLMSLDPLTAVHLVGELSRCKLWSAAVHTFSLVPVHGSVTGTLSVHCQGACPEQRRRSWNRVDKTHLGGQAARLLAQKRPALPAALRLTVQKGLRYPLLSGCQYEKARALRLYWKAVGGQS